MVTVGLVAVLATFAVPYFGETIKNNRLTTQINTLVGHLALARSESVTRNQQVAICISNTMTGCSGTSWKDGWIVYVDADGDSAFTAGEEILRVKQPLEGSANTLTSSFGNSYVYDSRGFSASGTGTFSLCDDRGVPKMKSVSISNTGRVRQGGAGAC